MWPSQRDLVPQPSPPSPATLDCRRLPRPLSLRLAAAMLCVPSPHAVCVCCLYEAAALFELDKFSLPRHVSVRLHMRHIETMVTCVNE